MTAATKKLSKSTIGAAFAGALLASVSALPAEAGGHDHHHGGGRQGGFHGQQMQRPIPRMPHVQPQIQNRPPQIQRQPQFNRAPHMQQQFNRMPDPRINRMQNQVREMQNQARQMQQIQRQREQMIYNQQRLQGQQERMMLQHQWRQQQRWGQQRYYNRPGYYVAPPVIQQGPTREDYDECAAVQQENDGCYVDTRGGIHYVERQQDNGAGAAAQILMNTLKTVTDLAEREKLQKQMQQLEQSKQTLEAQRDEAIRQRDEALKKAQPEPAPTVDKGELKGDEPKPAAPKP